MVTGPTDLRGAVLCPTRLGATPLVIAQGPVGPSTAPVRVALLAGVVALTGVASLGATAVLRGMGLLAERGQVNASLRIRLGAEQ
eukprot:7988580-Alexandrium_andersonii.AAC.1